VRSKNKRYTLAVRRLVDCDTASDVLAAFIDLLDGLEAGVKAAHFDRGFYDGNYPLRRHDLAFVMPIVRCRRRSSRNSRKGRIGSSSAIVRLPMPQRRCHPSFRPRASRRIR